MAQFYHIRETDNLDGDLSITISYTHLYTHTHKYTVCVTDSAPSYIYIYILIYSVSPHRVKYLFHRTDRPPSCMHVYIYTYTHTYILFHHTELTSVLPHRWPSFTTLGKPTVWMVTYLSPSYTPICTRVRTYTVCFTDIPPSYIYIYIYTLFHHTELSICFTAQIAHHHVYIYILIYS